MATRSRCHRRWADGSSSAESSITAAGAFTTTDLSIDIAAQAATGPALLLLEVFDPGGRRISANRLPVDVN